jgi:ubiquitin C-terminal hydrolase
VSSGKKACKTEDCVEDLEIYNLYGFVVHQGKSARSGHFYCTVKGADGMWYQCNDTRITKLRDGIDKEDTE